MKIAPLFLLSMSLFIGMTNLRAGEPAPQEVTTATDESLPAFRAGGHEIELRGGALFSILNNGIRKPVLNYSLGAARFGWMLDDVHHSGFLRGNNEFLLEILGADVFKGPRHFVVGSQAIWRYNFVQPGARLVPYFQLGAGGVYDDIYHNQVQHLIGEGFEFILHGGVGVRWMISDRWAASVEGDFRHISNAGLASRNQGLNSIGGTFGLNYLF